MRPCSAAEFIEGRPGAFERAIFLDQIEARERDVEFGLLGEHQQHEFAGLALRFELAQAIELADAVIDMDHVIAGLEIAEVAGEYGSFGFALGARDGQCFEQI